MMPRNSKKEFNILYLFLLITLLVHNAMAQSATRARIIRHDKGIDPLSNLQKMQIDSADVQSIFDGELFDLSLAMLDDEAAQDINWSMYENEAIGFDDPIVDNRVSPNSTDTTPAYVLEDTQPEIFSLPTDIPNCQANVSNNIRVVVLDSVFGQANFNHKVTSLGSAVGTSVCHSHGGIVAKIIDQMIPFGNMEINSYGVFDCSGNGMFVNIIAGIQAAKAAAKANPTIKYVINYSGSSLANSVMNSLFVEAEKVGIATYVAASNNAQDCMARSPASAAATSPVSSIGATCSYVTPTISSTFPCSFTNYEISASAPKNQCVTINVPGCVNALNPLTGRRGLSCGTSFASPLRAAQHVMAAENNPTLNAQQTKQALANYGVHKVPVPNGAHFSGLWDVLDSRYACPASFKRDLFIGTKVFGRLNGIFNQWHVGASLDQRFCVTFKANTDSAALFIGMRSSANQTLAFKADIGKYRTVPKRTRWFHELRTMGNLSALLDTQDTQGRILAKHPKYTDFVVKQENGLILVQYKNAGKPVTLLSHPFNEQLDQIGFSTGAGNVRVSNAMRCFL